MPVITIPTFHAGQVGVWAARGSRNAVRCGRRFGKTKMIVAIAADGAAKGRRVGVFAPTHKQLQEPYDELLYTLAPVISGSSKNDGVMKTRTRGKIDFWQLIDNELAGRGREYDTVLIDEGAFTKSPQMRDIWDKSIVPTMATRPNATAWVFSTPNGVDPDNFFYQVCNDAALGFTQHHAPSWSNPLVSSEWLATEKERMHPDVWRQEIEALEVDWSGVAFFDPEKWLVDGQPVEPPRVCDSVFAVMDTATKTGSGNDGTAVTYWARSRHGGHPLVLLDWELRQIEGATLITWLPAVLQELERWAQVCRARMGSVGAFVEDKDSGQVLLQQARNMSPPLATRPIEPRLTALGKDGRALAVSGHHYRGAVKMARTAYERVSTFKGTTRNHLVSQVTSFRIGDKDAARRADDALDAYTYGVALALGDAEGM